MKFRPLFWILIFCLQGIVGTLLANEGHRLGGDLYGDENTLKCFGKLLDTHGRSDKFEYAEYDIRESADGQLVCYHDASLRGRKIAELSLAEIRELKPDVPTVAEVYAFAAKRGLPEGKALVGDIKRLQTDKARTELLTLAKQYEDEFEVWYMGLVFNNKRSFSDKERWAVMFKRQKLPMFTPFIAKEKKNDQFTFVSKAALNWSYTTLLDKAVVFSNEKNRVQSYDVEVPNDVLKSSLRLGIKNGYDDTGDRKCRLRVLTRDTNQVLHDLHLGSRGWEWFVLPELPKKGVKIEWSDEDTKFSGRYPGNGIWLNVSLGVWDPLVKE